MLCFQPVILLLNKTDDLGVGNKEGYSLLSCWSKSMQHGPSFWNIFWQGEVQVPSIQNSLVELGTRDAETVVFSGTVSVIAVACQNRQVKS